MDDSFSKIATGIYRWMLHAYPRGFRDLYQADMLLDFQDACQTSRLEQGVRGVFKFWSLTTLDWIGSVLNERLRQTSYRSPLPLMVDITHFNNQLVSTVRLWERCLRGGYNVLQMLEIAAENAPEPTAGFLRDTLAQVEASGDLAGAIETMPDRLESSYLRRVVQVILDQRKTGGNLADRLQALNDELRAELGRESWGEDFDLNQNRN